jgi:hypothetical protein
MYDTILYIIIFYLYPISQINFLLDDVFRTNTFIIEI